MAVFEGRGMTEMPKNRTVKQYENDIKKRMCAVGTYREAFLPAIARLAMLYSQRDALEQKYKEDGGEPIVMHTNKSGATNQMKNPILTACDAVYTQILSHERELGLTPSALKRMKADAFQKDEKASPLEEAARRLLKDAGG